MFQFCACREKSTELLPETSLNELSLFLYLITVKFIPTFERYVV